MRTVGFIATGIAGLIVVAALAAAAVSTGDMKRYARMRRM